jgi:hypothetical protein
MLEYCSAGSVHQHVKILTLLCYLFVDVDEALCPPFGRALALVFELLSLTA